MLQPHLLPDAADLLRLALILVVAVLSAGMGYLAGARRLDIAFFAGWGLACLIFVIAGTWLQVDLAAAAAVTGVLGLLGLARRLLQVAAADTGEAGVAWRVLLIGAPFILLVLGMTDIAWDDFGFWVPNLMHLCTTHRFPSLAQPAIDSANAAYPYGVALAGFAVHLLGGGSVDTVALVWNLLAMLAAGAAFAAVLMQRMGMAGLPMNAGLRWAAAALGTVMMGLGNPAFVAKITLTNMGDSATGAGLAVLSAQIFDYATAQLEMPGRANRLLQIALTGCAIIFIRQANAALLILLLLSAAVGMLVFQSRMSVAQVCRFLATLLLPAIIWWSWTHYADRQIPNGRHYLLAWHDWRWSLFGSTLLAAARVLVAKSGYTVMALTMGGIAAFRLQRRLRGAVPGVGRDAPASAVMATTTAGLAFGNIAFLLFCYLATSFAPGEAAAAISFWRFIGQTGQSLMLGIACIVPMAWVVSCLRPPAVRIALPVIALLLPVVATTTYRDDLTSPVPALRRIAEGLHSVVPAGAPIALMDVTGNGFAGLVVKYQLDVIDGDRAPLTIVATAHGLSAVQAREALPAATAYLWLAEGSPVLGSQLGIPVRIGCSYLFRNDAGAYHLVRSWDIGPYRWVLAATDRTAVARGGCAG